MDVDAQLVGMEAERLLDAAHVVERVERRLRVQHHPPLGIDRVAPGVEQVVDVALLDAVTAQLDLDRGDVG